MHTKNTFATNLKWFFFEGPGGMMPGNQNMMQTGPPYAGQGGPGGPQMMQGGQHMMGGAGGPQQMGGAGYNGGPTGGYGGNRMQPYVQQQMQQGILV